MNTINKRVYKKDKVGRLIVIAIILLAPLVWIGIKAAKGLQEMEREDSFSKLLPSTYTMTHDDSTLFGRKYLNFIKVNEIIHHKARLPISVLRYNNEYWITVFRAPLYSSFPLDSIVHFEERNSNVTLNYTYWDLEKYSYYKVQYGALSVTRPIPTIYVTFARGAYATVLHTDTAISYSLQPDNLSIRYGKEAPKDIYISSNTRYEANQNIPINLMFIKRNHILYTLLMTPAEHDGTIPATLLPILF